MMVSPLFVKHNSLAPPSNGVIKGIDICYALEKVSGSDTVDGVQRIGGLYRIYLNNQKARDDLLVKGFELNGCNVSLLAQNPFSVSDTGNPTTKIVIGGIPLSVADSEIERVLLDKGVVMKSNIKLETYRDQDGKWTRFKTGRRFVYCEIPTLNIETTLQVGLWRASIYYKEQIRPNKPNYSYQNDTQTDTTENHERAVDNEGEQSVSKQNPEKNEVRLEQKNKLDMPNPNPKPRSTSDHQLLNEARGGGSTSPVSHEKAQPSANSTRSGTTGRKSRSKTRRSDQHKKGGFFDSFLSRSSSKRSLSTSASPGSKGSPNKYSRSVKGKQTTITNNYYSPRVDLLG